MSITSFSAGVALSMPGEVSNDTIHLPVPLHINLKEREIEVLKFLGLGYSIKETAAAMFLSSHTIMSYRKSIKFKLRCNKVTQLAVIAERMGLLTGLSFH